MTHPLKQRAQKVMPAGVNSPVRAFQSVGGDPFFAGSGSGSRLHTVDDRALIDFCMSFGPLILGHAHPAVVEAVTRAAARGLSYAVTTEAEIEFAELIQHAIPGMARLRLVSSGTEAVMTALRLARGFTGRNKILKFSGCYHGHSDGLLVEAGSGLAGLATASSAGVPTATARDTLVAPYNDPAHVARLVEQYGDDMAAIIVEPIAANMGLVPPRDGFLSHLRKLCDQSEALLIFDEVITGFRLTFGGYQNLCGIIPDLTCLGKIIGGGMPIGAVGGRADIMERIAPLGPVYQAGTLSGNPVSVAAGLATLKILEHENPYPLLEQKTASLVCALRESAEAHSLTMQIPAIGSLFSFFFTATQVHSFADVRHCDTTSFKTLFHGLLREGIYLPPAPFETCFTSTAHSDRDVEQTVIATRIIAESLGT